MQTMSASSHTFVRSVKAKDVCFDLVDPILTEIKGQSSPKNVVDGCSEAPKLSHQCYSEHHRHQGRRRWFIAEFTAPQESRNTLKVVGMGWNSLQMEISQWPKSLFAPNTLCYGFYRMDIPQEGLVDACFPPCFVSFCWKGRSLPIYLRTKYTEYHQVIRVNIQSSYICRLPTKCGENNICCYAYVIIRKKEAFWGLYSCQSAAFR